MNRLDMTPEERAADAAWRRQRKADTRAQLHAGRQIGLVRRHATKLARLEGATMATTITRCRYLRRNDQQCTAEVADPDADLLLCTKHLGRAFALVARRVAETRAEKQALLDPGRLP